jgi:hypothetical protein
MSKPVRILGIAGSLRRESYNRAALRAATQDFLWQTDSCGSSIFSDARRLITWLDRKLNLRGDE